MNETSVLKLEKVSKAHGKLNQTSVKVFCDINFELKLGEIVGLLGPSGSGKSSLLHISGLLDRPNSGEVYVLDNPVSGLSEFKRTALRRDTIGFVYQFNNLLPEFNALENVLLPQLIAGVKHDIALKRSKNLIEKVGLGARMYHRPLEMSGGEQQRIAVCRSISNDPRILLADEPTGNLDTENSEIVMNLIYSIVKETGMSALIATHNLEMVKSMDRVVRLEENKIHEVEN